MIDLGGIVIITIWTVAIVVLLICHCKLFRIREGRNTLAQGADHLGRIVHKSTTLLEQWRPNCSFHHHILVSWWPWKAFADIKWGYKSNADVKYAINLLQLKKKQKQTKQQPVINLLQMKNKTPYKLKLTKNTCYKPIAHAKPCYKCNMIPIFQPLSKSAGYTVKYIQCQLKFWVPVFLNIL